MRLLTVNPLKRQIHHATFNCVAHKMLEFIRNNKIIAKNIDQHITINKIFHGSKRAKRSS